MLVIPAAQEAKVGSPSQVQDLPGLQSKFKTSQGSSACFKGMGVGEMGWEGDRGRSEIELFIELRKGQNLLKFLHIFEKRTPEKSFLFIKMDEQNPQQCLVIRKGNGRRRGNWPSPFSPWAALSSVPCSSGSMVAPG